MAQLIPPDANRRRRNHQRRTCILAEAALLVFAQRTGMAKEMVGDKEDPFLIVSDMLADLAHWCDRCHVDLPAALVHAAHHYSAETKGYGRQFNP
jgi:hypothetical protein